jgi:phosphoribosylformimino-5-aminoimidazole carboxamide ribotide isomerase
MLEGVNFSLYQKLKGAFPHLIVWASGGVTAKEDLTALAETGIEGVITGKAIYEGKLSFQDMMPYR